MDHQFSDGNVLRRCARLSLRKPPSVSPDFGHHPQQLLLPRSRMSHSRIGELDFLYLQAIFSRCGTTEMFGSDKYREVVVAQLVERLLSIPEVRGSTPVIGKILLNICYYQLY